MLQLACSKGTPRRDQTLCWRQPGASVRLYRRPRALATFVHGQRLRTTPRQRRRLMTGVHHAAARRSDHSTARTISACRSDARARARARARQASRGSLCRPDGRALTGCRLARAHRRPSLTSAAATWCRNACATRNYATSAIARRCGSPVADLVDGDFEATNAGSETALAAAASITFIRAVPLLSTWPARSFRLRSG